MANSFDRVFRSEIFENTGFVGYTVKAGQQNIKYICNSTVQLQNTTSAVLEVSSETNRIFGLTASNEMDFMLSTTYSTILVDTNCPTS